MAHNKWLIKNGSSNFHFLSNIRTCRFFLHFCQMEAVNSLVLNCFLEFEFEELVAAVKKSLL